uniref:Uncharacterized protein n=1 Tax=viral metagenome TaxID=1070528 RepID=A0A6C0LFY4_9ZZZZ
MEEKLRCANERLLIKDNSNEEKDRNLIFVYCPPKVGSTSLVSSLRLFACEKYTVLHLHNEDVVKTLYDIDVSINDLIKHNSSLGKNIYVIDIYRLPIEHKISIFFEKLEKFHFNNVVEKIESYPIEKLIHRFNMIMPHLANYDYFRNEYHIPYPQTFDFEKKYGIIKHGNIQYIKLRLSDSDTYWSDILKDVLKIRNIRIVRDYETSEKSVKNIFKRFIEQYVVPENFLEDIRNNRAFTYYNTKEEQSQYVERWKKKSTSSVVSYTKEEYILYTNISRENKYMNEIQKDHYLDNGCYCQKCMEQRMQIRSKILCGEQVSLNIKHESIKPRRRMIRQIILKKPPKPTGVIGLNMMKGMQ